MSDTRVKDESSSAHEPGTLTFRELPPHLPCELAFQILQYWIAPESVIVEQASEILITSYACATDALKPTLPTYFQIEYCRLRHLSWLKSVKVFRTPYDFYMGHWLLSLDPASRLPFFTIVPHDLTRSYPAATVAVNRTPSLPLPHLPYHGLERIELDFDAAQYFALFDVYLPPFHVLDTWAAGDERYHDQHLHGAASFLQHTRHLVLRFGTSYKWAHPWSSVRDLFWAHARVRPGVCESGLIIDWILEYAWHGEFLQHIPSIELAGDVQPWVKAKWEAMFAEQAARNKLGNEDAFAVHTPDVDAIQSRGLVVGQELDWEPEGHYPPKCECEVACWRLQDGVVVEEVVSGVPQDWEESCMDDDCIAGDWDMDSFV